CRRPSLEAAWLGPAHRGHPRCPPRSAFAERVAGRRPRDPTATARDQRRCAGEEGPEGERSFHDTHAAARVVRGSPAAPPKGAGTPPEIRLARLRRAGAPRADRSETPTPRRPARVPRRVRCP